MDDLLETARVAARTAADLLRGAHAEHVTAKGEPNDLVTEWDLRAEDAIRAVLAERAPGVPVLGEEGGQQGHDADLRWLVDPIDGTVNFAHGLPIWSVSIAVEQRGEAIGGV